MEHTRHSKEMLAWRERQGRGAIMSPETFEHIKRSAAARGATDPEKVAGAAYWKTARAKFSNRKRRGKRSANFDRLRKMAME